MLTHDNAAALMVFVLSGPVTSAWPYLRCDVGLEEEEY